MYGLAERDFVYIRQAVEHFPEIEKIVLFGSRALGTFKKGSDVDIAVSGTGVTRETVLRLSGLLNDELPLPYTFDILQFDTITNAALREHIQAFGVPLFLG